ncbi:MAG: Plug domain-containing protein [Gemmatimonadaceae bacterium]|nr:Plug domain-containing protein [Gemmatimonadaceae bacterium]
MRQRAMRWLVGLGLLAGAVLYPVVAGAQDTIRPPVRDTVVRFPIPLQPDTIARRDSAARGGPTLETPARGDSIQPSLAQPEMPRLTDAALAPLSWTRDSLMATGAITLADLLDRVPGLTSLRTTWLGTAAAGAYLGDVTRVRVFLDGIELDPAEPRGGDAFDLSRVPLWALDELRIERTAGEVRVHARSWQVTRTTPYSRADISTGDQDTDLFRFFFGRRFGNGLAVQAAVDQFSMTPDRAGATNSQTSLLARVGWARHDWQADAFILRSTPRRGVLFDETNSRSIPAIDLMRTEAYLRAGWGSTDGPAWVQATAAALGFRYTGIRDPQADTLVIDVDPITGDTTRTFIPADTGRFQGQYALSGGVRRGVLQLSATHRMRVIGGSAYQTPSARASAELGMLTLAANVEGQGIDSVARQDVSARVALGFARAGASLARRDDARAGGVAGIDWRAEGALRLASLWVGGGLMSRAATTLRPPAVFNRPSIASAEPAALGTFAAVQGTVWGPLQLDVLGERWQDVQRAFRPQFATRADLFVRSNFRERFPTGNFGLYALMRHEYRSATFFPTDGGFEQAPGHRIISSLLEIRILDATLTYQFRNMLGTRVRMVPGYELPRQTQLYGVRWTFWN